MKDKEIEKEHVHYIDEKGTLEGYPSMIGKWNTEYHEAVE
jgi:hypothetical protein